MFEELRTILRFKLRLVEMFLQQLLTTVISLVMQWKGPSSPVARLRRPLMISAILLINYGLISCIDAFPSVQNLVCTMGRTATATLAALLTSFIARYRRVLRNRKCKVDSHGKAVLITGCDSGFGFETALRLYCEGYHVFAGCLYPEVNGALTLKKVDNGQRLMPIKMDVTDDENLSEVMQQIEQTLETENLVLWAVINNAGVCSFCELEFCSMDTFQKTLDVNALGTIRVTQRVLPMLRRSQGRVIIISSLAGYLSYAGLTAYCMSKHALVGVADCLRKELAKFNLPVVIIPSIGYRTQMLNPAQLSRDMDSNWNSASDEVREAYGEDYFKKFRHNYLSRLGGIKEPVGEAVDCIVGAVQTPEPEDMYYTSWKGELRNFARHLPPSWQDLYMRIFESFEPLLTFLSPNEVPRSGQDILEDLERRRMINEEVLVKNGAQAAQEPVESRIDGEKYFAKLVTYVSTDDKSL